MKKLLGSFIMFFTVISFASEVVPMDVKNLLDAKNSYPTTAFDWESLLPYVNGIIFLLAGFITAKLDILTYLKKRKKSQSPVDKKIKEAKDEKELLKVLLSFNSTKYKDAIDKLEMSIYEDKKVDFNTIKVSLSNQ